MLGVILVQQTVASDVLAQQIKEAQTAAEVPDSFVFATDDFRHYHPVLLGNGYLVLATSWNGTSPTSSSVVGLYDHLEEKAYSYQGLVPSWNEVDYWNGSHWLNQLPVDEFNATSYRQSLDLRRGILLTQHDWVDGPRITHVEVESFTARQVAGLGVVRFSFTPSYGVEAGPITVSFPLGGGDAQPFVWEGMPLPEAPPIGRVEGDSDRRGFRITSSTRDHSTAVAEAVRVELPGELDASQVSLGLISNPSHPSLNVKFIVKTGQTYTFVKYSGVAAATSEPEALRLAQDTAHLASKRGYAALLGAQEQAWKELWRSDIVIDGDPEAQRSVHAALFYLISLLRPGAEWSVPAVALPSRAYLGRVWWDADTFVFPSLLLLHPDLARSIVGYRERMLPGAVQNAKNHGHSGAQFPMESAGTGLEEAPEWSSEIHEGGDVALAQWHYYQATGDKQWLREHGYPVIRGVADFWVSRVEYNREKDRYEIRHLTGPNEAITGVDNDAYTNAVARETLVAANEAAGVLGNAPNPAWARIAAKLYIPFDGAKQFHLEHDGDSEGRYAHTVAMLAYPLGLAMPEEVRRNDLEACMKNFMKPGYEVGMLGNFYSVVASELQRGDLAYELFQHMERSYAKPPFYAMSETPENNRFVFLTAEGAFLQQVLYGFTGLRLTVTGLTRKFPPSLPRAWNSLEIRNMHVRGKRLNVRVDKQGAVSIKPAD